MVVAVYNISISICPIYNYFFLTYLGFVSFSGNGIDFSGSIFPFWSSCFSIPHTSPTASEKYGGKTVLETSAQSFFYT